MPTPTYVAIAKTVLTGTQGTITFSAIPSTYTDLIIKISARTDNTGSFANYVRFNSDTGTNYSWRNIYGYNSAAYSDSLTSSTYAWGGYGNNSSLTASSFCNSEIYIPSYAGSNKKAVSAEGAMETNATTGVSIGAQASLWNNTAAITTIDITSSAGSFVSGSRFDLYGIKNS